MHHSLRLLVAIGISLLLLRAMLDQFLSQDPDIRSGKLKRIGEQDVDVAPIINQFQQSRQTNT